MKIKFYVRKCLLSLLSIGLVFSLETLSAQQILINVNGWNAYVHVPWDYSVNPGKTYPTIIFFPGIGEVGSNPALLIANGPGAYIQQGWNGNVKVGTDSVKFIVISLQPPSAWPIEYSMNVCIQTLKGMYRIDNSRLHLTGLSMGGWCSTTFVTGDAAGGPYTYATQVATVTEVEGVKPDDNSPYPNLFDNFAAAGGRLLGFEQLYDSRDILTRVNRMNSKKANSGIYISTNYGGGGHCCWEKFYGGNGAPPNNFTLDGISQNIYQWMARNPLPSGGATNISPTVNAGNDISITLPSNSVTLNGSGSDADGTITGYSWSKISGPLSYNMTNPNAATTSVNSLSQGVYNFTLTVTDNGGLSVKDTMQVTVNAAGNAPPVAGAGSDVTIKLPTNAVTLNGSGTDADGTISSFLWSKLSGPSAGNIVNPTSASTSINSLQQGTYQFLLIVTDNGGLTAKDTVQVIVNGIGNQPPVASAGNDAAIKLPTNTVTLNGSATDADGTISSYKWKKVSGPFIFFSFSGKNSAKVSVKNLVQGIYMFELAVTDNSGSIGKDSVVVTVNSKTSSRPFEETNTTTNTILQDKEIELPKYKNINVEHVTLFNSQLSLNISSSKPQIINIKVVDVSSRVYFSASVSMQAGINSINKFIPGLQSGVFYVMFFTNEKMVAKPVFNLESK